jgi:hypothetical protein
MNNRIKRFNVGNRVSLHGKTGTVKEAHCDPHPKEFSHCSGNSARYVVSFADGAQTCWDWQLSPAPWCPPAFFLEEPAPSLEEAVGLVQDFKRRFPRIANFFSSCKPSSTNSDLTPTANTPAG